MHACNSDAWFTFIFAAKHLIYLSLFHILFLFYFPSYFYSLFILIPLLFLFILFNETDKEKINDDKREEIGQI